DRWAGCNTASKALYPEIADQLQPGRTYRELMTYYYGVAPPDVIDSRSLDQFLTDGERRRRSGSGVSEVVRHHRGRWLLITDCRTAEGGIISFRTDVTEQKVIEHELTKRRRLIDDLADLTYDWFWRQDAEGRFVEFSAAMELHVKSPPDQLLGRRREEMPGFEADPNQYAEHRPRTEREDIVPALRRSEERFRALTMLATEWYWETDNELRVTSIRGDPTRQQRVAEWTLTRRLWEFEHPDPAFPVDWNALRDRVMRRESFRNVKLKLSNDDDVSYYELAGQPVFERGDYIGYRGLAWDVTERESLIARISESEARFRALTELSSDWYWEMDENLRFTQLRQGARGSFGLSDDEVLGKHRWELPGELIQPSSWDEHRATLMARRSFRDVMFRRWMPDGSLVYHLTSGDPVLDAEGNFRGY